MHVIQHQYAYDMLNQGACSRHGKDPAELSVRMLPFREASLKFLTKVLEHLQMRKLPLQGPYTSQLKLVGNAVPMLFGWAILGAVFEAAYGIKAPKPAFLAGRPVSDGEEESIWICDIVQIYMVCVLC